MEVTYRWVCQGDDNWLSVIGLEFVPWFLHEITHNRNWQQKSKVIAETLSSLCLNSWSDNNESEQIPFCCERAMKSFNSSYHLLHLISLCSPFNNMTAHSIKYQSPTLNFNGEEEAEFKLWWCHVIFRSTFQSQLSCILFNIPVYIPRWPTPLKWQSNWKGMHSPIKVYYCFTVDFVEWQRGC